MVLSYTEMNSICEYAINTCPAHLYEVKTCMELMLVTGCRVEETYNKSRWTQGTGGVWILASSKESNTRYFNGSDLPEDWQAVFNDGTRLNTYVNYRKIQYYLKTSIGQFNVSVGNKQVLAHLFRHTYVQALKFFGSTLTQAQETIGHKSTSSTLRYYEGIVIADTIPA